MLKHIDVDSLNKGSIISRETICREFGISDEDDYKKYRFSSMKLSDIITQQLSDRGIECVIKTNDVHLQILEDNEAALYLAKEFKRGMRFVTKKHNQQLKAIDKNNLTPQMLQIHNHSVAYNSRILQAVNREVVWIKTQKKAKDSTPQPVRVTVD